MKEAIQQEAIQRRVKAPDLPVAEFSWGGFYARWLGAVLAMTAVAVAAYLFIHELLYDWSEVDRRTRESIHIADRLLEAVQLLVRLVLEVLHPSWFTWTLAAGAPLLALVVAGLRTSRAERIGGSGVAESLGAVPVTGAEKEPVRRVLFECVAAQALARGIAAPPLFLLDELESVCAASFGSGPADAALAFSRGAAARLDPVTLEALAAWQFAALEGGRLHRDLRIAGFLHPFLWLWLMADAMWRLEQRMDWLQNKTTPDIPIIASPLWNFTFAMRYMAMTVRLMLRVAGFPGLAMGRLLQREALADDVRLRDRAVAATLPDPEALAAALRQSVPQKQALEDLGDELFAAQAEAVEYAHAFFAEPAPLPQEPRLAGLARRLASHEDPLARLRRFAPRFDPAAYELRTAKIAGDKVALSFAHGTPDASMLAAGATPAAPAAAVTAARREIGDPAEELPRAEFFLRFERPVLDHFRTPQGASRVLRAAVAPAAPGNAALRPVLERLSTRERRWVIERGLAALREAPEGMRSAHLRAHRLLIEMDRRVTPEELADWLYVERALELSPAAAPVQATTPADAALLQAMLADSGALDAAALESAVRRLRAAPVPARVQAVRGCLGAARADGSVSEAESEVLRRLCFVFDLSPALLGAGDAKVAVASAEADYPPPAGAVLRARSGADELPVARACTRCTSRAGLYRHAPSAGDTIADWLLPVLFVVALGLVVYWLNGPHRSLRPNAWRDAILIWLFFSTCIVGSMLHFDLFLKDTVMPRWLSVVFSLLLLAAGLVLSYVLDLGLGVMAGNSTICLSLLAHALTRKMPVPGGTFYFCRSCGITTPVTAG